MSRCGCGLRFARLGPPLYQLSAFTASLHVAPGRYTTMLNPMQILAFAPWHVLALGHKRIASCPNDVRFTPESGHVRCNSGCPLWANSGHRLMKERPPSSGGLSVVRFDYLTARRVGLLFS